mmetsp:Transcript_17846/g.51941  ORF Transcript_17846/g.51941 Transcript_17846/m.51941 type:complete len:211 (-) Transcript_17846:1213-1845(-)
MEIWPGSGTFITWKWRLARLGMSCLPPPGWSMHPRTRRSTICMISPGFWRLYSPPCSMSCRTISRVGWSPQLLISGIEISSTKTSMLFPPGGPKVLPWRFSTEPSTVLWKMSGVVAAENEIFFASTDDWSCLARTWRMDVVFAVPGPPMSSTARWREMDVSRMNMVRTESTVGIVRVGKSEARSWPSYFHCGTRESQCIHVQVASSTKYS